jgi:hypothetical protein
LCLTTLCGVEPGVVEPGIRESGNQIKRRPRQIVEAV